MPSAESDALRNAYSLMSQRIATNPKMDMQSLREMVGELQAQASEPAEVAYEEVVYSNQAALWCKPVAAKPDRVILYTHGGGYISDTKDTVRKLAGHLAKASNSIAFVPDYRLAPESTFPAQLDDMVTAYHWLLRHGFRADSIAIAGESAGGNFATATVLKLKMDGVSLPTAIVGFSPWFDLEGVGKTFDTNAATDAFLSRQASQMMAKMFLGSDHKPTEPLVNPLYGDLRGFPPMYLVAGSHENLLSSIQEFTARTKSAGVAVTLEVSEGMQHAFVYMAGRAP